jgi:hypothetical protein
MYLGIKTVFVSSLNQNIESDKSANTVAKQMA